MVITEQQMFDYMFCPAKFDLKYNKKIDIRDPVTFNKLLNTVARYMYLSIFRNKVPTMNELKNKWDSVCKNYPEFIDQKKNIQGISLINTLFKWAYDNKICVVDIDTPYTITIDNTQLAGNLSPILITGEGKMELLSTDFNNRMKELTEVNMDLKLTIDTFAYKSIYNTSIDCVKYHNVKYDKDILTFRSQPDFERVKSAIKGVAAGINAKAYYPRENVLCQSCTAKEYCRYWHI